MSVITWLLRDFADDWFLNNSSVFFSYCSNPAYTQLCSEKEVAVRISFATFSFFMLHAILMFMCKHEEDPRVALHTSLWGLRLLVWAGGCDGRVVDLPRRQLQLPQ